MRHSLRGAIGLFVCMLLVVPPLAPPAKAADEGFGTTILKAAGSSAAGKGASSPSSSWAA